MGLDLQSRLAGKFGEDLAQEQSLGLQRHAPSFGHFGRVVGGAAGTGTENQEEGEKKEEQTPQHAGNLRADTQAGRNLILRR
jgi:hypothetical protein